MNRIVCALVLTTTLSICGCGGGGATGGVPVHTAGGVITMFGKPLPGATVAFAPQGGQPTATGRTNAEGKFELTTYEYGDGAAEGNYKVIVSKASAAPASDSGEGEDHDVPVSEEHGEDDGPGGAGGDIVPAQYTTARDTPFSADVKAGGDNTFTFNIE